MGENSLFALHTILTIVYLFLTGYPISNMPPLVHVTERSIRNLLEDVITRFKKYEALIAVFTTRMLLWINQLH